MIRIQQLKLPIPYGKAELEEGICRLLKIDREQILSCRIIRQSLDARRKGDIHYVCSVEVEAAGEGRILRRIRRTDVCHIEKKEYRFPAKGTLPLGSRPVIAGSGPAGLFCAYMLSAQGYAPVILERGKRMEERQRDVAAFWKGGILDAESNVQFGEGGAGTFSDGKLNTMERDAEGRGRKVLEVFAEHGAPGDILYEAKPHIGTDVLAEVIPGIRRTIESMGGTFLFESCLTDLKVKNHRLCGVQVSSRGRIAWMDADILVLAIGHSARDTFQMLYFREIPMVPKPFAVGLRVEHPQEMIDACQYGEMASLLPPASYKLTARGLGGRGVYSFCMCPGGYVVNASSEESRLAVNGMSDRGRDSGNANSAIIVTVTPEDFRRSGAFDGMMSGQDLRDEGFSAEGAASWKDSADSIAYREGSADGGFPLGGIAFQRSLEAAAYALGGGAIPQQLYGDFKRGRASRAYGGFASLTKGAGVLAPLHRLFPEEIASSFCLGMEAFGKRLPGFAGEDVILSGVESRTSSPVRILRGGDFQSQVEGIYPCGEGAGYAGGIMSAAVDGIKVAEALAAKFAPFGCR